LGAATLVGLIAIAIRLALVHALHHIHLNPYPWTIQLPLWIAIDVIHGLRSKRLEWWQLAVFVIVIGSITTLPLINVFFDFPHITQATILPMFLAFSCGIAFASWLGILVGDALVSNDTQATVVELASSVQLLLLVLLGAFSFAVWFVLTAHPPV
jgi:hypothetical protein